MDVPFSGTLTKHDRVDVSWTKPDDGGSQMKQGDKWVDVFGGPDGADYNGSSYLITNSIEPSQPYDFRIKARNKWGWATLFSPASQIITPALPTTKEKDSNP